MSLYHETAEILSQPSSTGGNLKTRIFTNTKLKSPAQQIYALAVESCKWSAVLKEVIEASDLLRHERKLSPVLALLLVHDHLVSKGGIALPATHGLRASIERHKARLSSELTRARIRRKAGTMDQLRDLVTAEYLEATGAYPRWVRVNTIRSTLEDQLDGTFKGFNRVQTIKEVTSTPGRNLYLDAHVPNLVAISPAFEIIKTDAYKNGEVILQDKASCFPAYLLDPVAGDVIDSCSAPGNKTTHIAAIVNSRVAEGEECIQKVFAFEKDKNRSRTLEKMVRIAGGDGIVRMSFGQDFLKVDPLSPLYDNVTCLLLDPSCSGSGIVGRDNMPTIHLPQGPDSKKTASKTQPQPGGASSSSSSNNKKRKREDKVDKQSTKAEEEVEQRTMIDDDGKETVVSSEQELKKRLDALASFQFVLVLHALEFPAARRVTYSTCSIHTEENEGVVHRVLQSEVARRRGWRVMRRDEQVSGMRKWPVRGVETSGSAEDKVVADACIRSYKDDGRGVMGFFVAGFVRDEDAAERDIEGPYVRDEDGRIVRDMMGMPTLKSTGDSVMQDSNPGDDKRGKPASKQKHAPSTKQTVAPAAAGSSDDDSGSEDSSGDEDEEDDEEEWGGFD
ncbi:NOL1/NOP2/sun family protein [Microdochium bolleyi]|uniref:NOL1/NOP2/sun family protein n=1 Tax=Microdochium bolleyi TaxID=196109 RepID=A0A136JKR6_9PEZI|nr:NOL1/NOP2/sun family protein [Microdochium bolleyi]